MPTRCPNALGAPCIYAMMKGDVLYCAWNSQQIVAVTNDNCPRSRCIKEWPLKNDYRGNPGKADQG